MWYFMLRLLHTYVYVKTIDFHFRLQILAISILLWNKQGKKYLWIMFPSTTTLLAWNLQMKF